MKLTDILAGVSFIMCGVAMLILSIGFVYASLTNEEPRSCAPEWGIYYQQVANDDPHAGQALEQAIMCEESK